MNHIRFLSNNLAVCDKPILLGSDFVIVDYAEGKSCNMCLALILAHNERSRQYDLLVELPKTNHGAGSMEDNPLSPARGLLIGISVSSIFWIVLFLILHLKGVV